MCGGVVCLVGTGQLALEPLKVGLRGAVFQLPGNLGLLRLRPAAAHGGTPSRNNGAARCEGGSDLSVSLLVLTTLYRACAPGAGRAWLSPVRPRGPRSAAVTWIIV